MTASPPLSASLADAVAVLELFLTGYWSQRRRTNYAFILDGWFAWCAVHHHDPLREADPRVVERWIIDLQTRRDAANTVAGRVSAVSAFYRWRVRERLIDRNRRRHPPSRRADRVHHGEPDPSSANRLARHRRTPRRRVVGRRHAPRSMGCGAAS